MGAAEAALVTCDWEWAERELRSIAAADLDHQDQAAVISQLVTFGTFKGADVRSDFEQYKRLISGSSDMLFVGATHELNGILAWVDGRLAAAHVDLLEAARLSGQFAPARYPAAARVALWAGDPKAAAEDLDALAAIGAHGPAIELRTVAIRAGIAAASNRTSEALRLYLVTLEQARDLKLPWEEALIGLDMAILLDTAMPEVRLAAESARDILAGLGAKPFLAQLDATMMRQQTTAEDPEPATPGHGERVRASDA